MTLKTRVGCACAQRGESGSCPAASRTAADPGRVWQHENAHVKRSPWRRGITTHLLQKLRQALNLACHKSPKLSWLFSFPLMPFCQVPEHDFSATLMDYFLSRPTKFSELEWFADSRHQPNPALRVQFQGVAPPQLQETPHEERNDVYWNRAPRFVPWCCPLSGAPGFTQNAPCVRPLHVTGR